MNTRSAAVYRGVVSVFACLAAPLLVFATPAQAEFGLRNPLVFTQSASSIAADPTFPANPGDLFTQAGGHPYEVTTSFDLNLQSGSSSPDGNLKDLVFTLPEGFTAHPESAARCPQSRLTSDTRPCPVDSQVGIAAPFLNDVPNNGLGPVPVYNLTSQSRQSIELGFVIAGSAPIILHGGLSAGAQPRLQLSHFDTPPVAVTGLSITLWGVPAASGHDAVRAFPRALPQPGACQAAEVPCEFGAASTADPTPFLTSPTDCSAGLQLAGLDIDSYQDLEPKLFTAEGPASSGCDELTFAPTLNVRPDNARAGAPAGYAVDLHIPQSNDVETLATPPLKEATIALPAGVSLSPAAANGLEACTNERIGLDAGGTPMCPPASRVGIVEIHTPLVAAPLVGGIYLGTPQCEPCGDDDARSGRMVRLYFEAQGSGMEIELPGAIGVDPMGGPLTAMIKESPQLPFEDIHLEFQSGPRALFANPASCGTAIATSNLEPWSAPITADATPSDHFEIDSGPNDGPCVSPGDRPFAPAFAAGTLLPIGGTHSPLTVDLSREDGQQQFSRFDITTPRGLLATLRGASYCTDEALAAAASLGGRRESASSPCPAASQVGIVTVAAGPGPDPLDVTGKVYLAGPYRGAPLSVAAIVPAVAGPFDLGTTVVRSAVEVDPADAHLHIVSGQLPHVLSGIPLDIRGIHVSLNRSGFTLNPTSCDPLSITADIFGSSGAMDQISTPYQAMACGAIPFRPKFMARMAGGTRRTEHPAFHNTVVEGYPGEVSPETISVALPHSEFLDQAHVRTICTRVQLSADDCPAGSVYGHARALSPLVDYPLEGPVYLLSSQHLAPDLLIDLRGPAWQPIEIHLDGRFDTSKDGGIRTTFEGFPDAEISKFFLRMQGGKKGLLINSTDLCLHTHRFKVKITAYNGLTANQSPVLGDSCKKKRKRPAARHRKPGARGAHPKARHRHVESPSTPSGAS